MDYSIKTDELPADLVPAAGEVLEIHKRKDSREPLPPYNIVGNGMANRHGESVDILEVCLLLNTAELKVLQFFRTMFTMKVINKDAEPNVIVPTNSIEFSDYLKVGLMKNYMHLEYVGAIRRLKRGSYVLNPRIFLPPRNYLKMVALWENAKKDDDAVSI